MTNSNCKYECYNYELCKALGNIPNNLTAFGSCKFYKNRILVCDLPCKVGDTVYILEYENDTPVDYSGYIFIMSNADFAFLSPVLNCESNPVEICNEYFQRSIDEEDNSGIIVPIAEIFLTKAEAEAKLKELKENA